MICARQNMIWSIWNSAHDWTYIKLQLHYNLHLIGAVTVERVNDVQGCNTISMINYACAKQLKAIRMQCFNFFRISNSRITMSLRIGRCRITVRQLIPKCILESVIIAERFRNISWMQQRAIRHNDEKLVVALSSRGLPLSAGRTLLLTKKKVCESVTEKHYKINY